MPRDDLIYRTRVQDEPVEMASTADSALTRADWTTTLSVLNEEIGQALGIERVQNERAYQQELEPLRRELAALRASVDTLITLCGVKAPDLEAAVAAAKTPGPRGLPGPAGAKGARGERGVAGPSIIDWIVDRERFVVHPVMSNGQRGAALELRPLFEQLLTDQSQ